MKSMKWLISVEDTVLTPGSSYPTTADKYTATETGYYRYRGVDAKAWAMHVESRHTAAEFKQAVIQTGRLRHANQPVRYRHPWSNDCQFVRELD